MSGSRARDVGRRPGRGHDAGGLWPVWAGIAVGPLAWGVAVAASYALVPVACDLGSRLPLHGVRLVTTAVAAAATWAALGAWRRSRGASAAAPIERTALLALCGVALSGLSTALIVLEGVANFVLDPCR